MKLGKLFSLNNFSVIKSNLQKKTKNLWVFSNNPKSDIKTDI